MPDVLLINTSFQPKGSKFYHRLSPPLGLLTVASPLVKSGFEVELIDPQIDEDYMERVERAVRKRPLFVGMTTFMGPNIANAIEISSAIKKLAPQLPIVWGGPLATSSPSLCFSNSRVDYIAMGMGEETIVNIARALKESGDVTRLAHVCHRNGNNERIKDVFFFTGDLDELPYPDLELWAEGIRQLDTIPILSSRGCPRNCAFCYNNTFSGRKKWYGRSAEHVINEMDRWASVFKITKFYFVDDNFLVDTARACTILDKSCERGYSITQILGNLNDFKPAIVNRIQKYIDYVHFSIEAATPKIQKLLNKPIDLDRAVDLIREFTQKGVKKITTNFMFGLPTETDDDIGANIALAVKIRNINKDMRIVPYIYTPQPKDDIIPQFEFFDKLVFSIDALSNVDFVPNRSNILVHEIRPWMSKANIDFYLDLVLVWFYHFDHVVRGSQDIDVAGILSKNKRLAKLFADVPMPE